MKTKSICSYIYSDQTINYLKECGFHVVITDQDIMGYRTAHIWLQDENSQIVALTFFEILDEDLFLLNKFKNQKRDRIQLNPCALEEEAQESLVSIDKNFKFLFLVDRLQLKSEPWVEYLKIRKNTELLAVALETKSYKDIQKSIKFDLEFSYDGRSGGLIHLGTNCIDLIILEER